MCVVHRQSIDLKDKDVSFWRRTTHISRFCVMLRVNPEAKRRLFAPP
jgi:hypothetical protein